jgi:hypothetical protein
MLDCARIEGAIRIFAERRRLGSRHSTRHLSYKVEVPQGCGDQGDEDGLFRVSITNPHLPV